MTAGFCHRTSAEDVQAIQRSGQISPAFVTTTSSKYCLVIDHTVVNECLVERTFRMDQLSDLAPSHRRDDFLLKADIRDAHYHLRLRKEDQFYLSFSVGAVVYVPSCMNCGLAVASWFFTKAMKQVVACLRAKCHRVFSYLDEFFGDGAMTRGDQPATKADTARVGMEIEVSIRAPRPHPVPNKVRLCGCAVARSFGDPKGHFPRAISPSPGEASQDRVRSAAAAYARGSASEARASESFAKFRGARQLDRARGCRRAAASPGVVRRPVACGPARN
jgi:hypothetical protein